MFGKLIKYEMKSLCKGLLPIYGAILVVAFINSFTFNIDVRTEVGIWAQTAAIMCYVALIVGIAVMTLVIIVQRFYKGLLGQEGYLMFTLPVPTWQLTFSKLLGASIMAVLSMLVGFLSVFIFGFGAGELDVTELFDVIQEFLVYADLNGTLLMLEIFIAMLVNIAASICQIYLAIALGHLANQHRVLMSVVWYIILNTVLTFVSGVLVSGMIPFMPNLLNSMLFDWGQHWIHSSIWIGIGFVVIQAAIFYFATNYILKNKLNLE